MTDVGKLLDHFRGEVTAAVWSYYALKSINVVGSGDPAVLKGLNQNALAWNAVTHSLQATYLITLGRIFDVDGGALTIHSFLNKCKTEVGQFSRAELLNRKIAGAGGVKPDWADAYVAAAYEAIAEDFRELKREAVPHQRKYEAIYRPIRNQLIAHKDMGALGSAGVLFSKTNVGDIEAFILFVHQVEGVVFQLYANGRKTTLSDHKLSEDDRVKTDIESLLAKIRA